MAEQEVPTTTTPAQEAPAPEKVEEAPDTTRADAIAAIDKLLDGERADAQEPEADAPETEKVQEPADETPTELPSDLLASARSIGITKSQARLMGEDAVRAMVDRFTATEPEDVAETPEPPTKPAKPTKPSKVAEAESDEFAIDESALDPETVAIVRRLHDHYAPRVKKAEAVADEVAALKSQLSQVSQFFERQQAQVLHQQAVTRFDAAIESLGEGWHDVLGKGPSLALDRKSDHFSNRDQLADLIGAIFPHGSTVDEAKYAKVLRGLANGQFEEHATKISKRQQSARIHRAQDGKFQSGETKRSGQEQTPTPTTREEFAAEFERRHPEFASGGRRG